MRNFPDFITAYMNYARDHFCPDEFHQWTGLSVMASAIERKVSLKQGKNYHIPNLYVMLVSHPAVGKSTAMNRGVDLLEELRVRHNRSIRFVSNQSTEPAMVKSMLLKEYFTVAEGKIQIPHSSVFFYASEASSSALQNTCGNFVATLTDLFDCPKKFASSTISRGDLEIENACVNLLAGSTFNYLRELVNEKSVLGGFASRLIYVVNKERKVRETKWEEEVTEDKELKDKLLEDLLQINKLAGPMKPTAGFIDRIEKWQPNFDRELIAMKSERLEAMSSRRGTYLIKLSILMSISEGDSLVVTEKHFDRALELLESVVKDNAYVLAQSMIANSADSQSGLNLYIIRAAKTAGGTISKQSLRQAALLSGNETSRINNTLEYMVESKVLQYDMDKSTYKLLIDPDIYL
jgi:hypothetical protein